MGIRDLQSYLRILGMSEEEYLESSRPAAEQDLRQNLLLWEFIEREKIELPAGTEERLRAVAEAEAPGLLNQYANDDSPDPEVVVERLVELRLADELRRRQDDAEDGTAGHLPGSPGTRGARPCERRGRLKLLHQVK